MTLEELREACAKVAEGYDPGGPGRTPSLTCAEVAAAIRAIPLPPAPVDTAAIMTETIESHTRRAIKSKAERERIADSFRPATVDATQGTPLPLFETAQGEELTRLRNRVAEALEMTKPNQRLFDLVRHQRSELLDAGLITSEEYAALVASTAPGVPMPPNGGSPSPRRLEDYDRAKAAFAAERDAALASALESRQQADALRLELAKRGR